MCGSALTRLIVLKGILLQPIDASYGHIYVAAERDRSALCLFLIVYGEIASGLWMTEVDRERERRSVGNGLSCFAISLSLAFCLYNCTPCAGFLAFFPLESIDHASLTFNHSFCNFTRSHEFVLLIASG